MKTYRPQLGFELSPRFWQRFATQHLEKCPVFLKHPFHSLLTTPVSIFQNLVRISEEFREAGSHRLLKFFVDDTMLLTDIKQYLPIAADRDLASYAERVTNMLSGRRFGLVVYSQYPSWDVETWLRLRSFLRALYEVVGIPGYPPQTELFVGNYDKTPFGVHRDDHGTFVFVIEGRKRFRTWPGDFFGPEINVERTINYKAFLDDAITLDGDPGDLLYWPSSYWHVAESVGTLSISINVALFSNFHPATDVLEQWLEKLPLPAKRMPVFYPDDLPKRLSTLPRFIERTTDSLGTALNSSKLQRALAVEWLNRLTSFGDSVPPPLPARRLRDEDVIFTDRNYPIIWLASDSDEITCSTNGHSFTILAHPAVVNMLRCLNTGKLCRVKTLIDHYSGNATVGGVDFQAEPEEVRALLGKLWSLRAVQVAKDKARRV